MTPLGIRLNNPANLRKSKDKWQGLAEKQSHKSFFTFTSAVYGIRACARTLINYQDKYRLRTISGIIKRWAPPQENDTSAYINSVVISTGFSADMKLDLHTYAHLRPLVTAIIRHENGQQPYTDAQIDKALALAGVEIPQKAVHKTGTVKASTVGFGTATGAGTIDAFQDTINTAAGPLQDLAPMLEWAKYALLAITLLSFGYVIWRRYDDSRKLAR